MTRSHARRDLMSNELLDRAATLFAERGFAGTTLQEIADVMGISRPALYHYISSKEELLSQLVQGITKTTADAMTELRSDDARPADERLHDAILDMTRRIASNPSRFKLLDRSEHNLSPEDAEEHRTAKRRVLEELREIVRQGINEGLFRPVNDTVTAFAILGMCNWVAWWFHPDTGELDADELAEEFSRLVMDGLLSHGDSGEVSLQTAFRRLQEDVNLLERVIETH